MILVIHPRQCGAIFTALEAACAAAVPQLDAQAFPFEESERPLSFDHRLRNAYLDVDACVYIPGQPGEPEDWRSASVLHFARQMSWPMIVLSPLSLTDPGAANDSFRAFAGQVEGSIPRHWVVGHFNVEAPGAFCDRLLALYGQGWYGRYHADPALLSLQPVGRKDEVPDLARFRGIHDARRRS